MTPTRYRHVWPGVLLLASLAFLLGVLLGWGDHFLSPGPPGGIGRLLETWSASRVPDDISPAHAHGHPTDSEAGARQASGDADRGSLILAPAEGQMSPAEATANHPSGEDSTAAAVVRASRPTAAARSGVRYALHLGSFVLVEDAERAEVRLNEAGFSTVRFRQQEPVRLFSVFTTPPATEEGETAVAQLREEGFVQAALTGPASAREIRVTRGVPLRTAVRTAERLRAAGHEPRVVAEVARTGRITLRHGNFTSWEEAETAGRDIARLGVVYEVIEIR